MIDQQSATSGKGSRLLRRGSVDGRSTEGRFLATSRAELVAHLGGNPSATQLVLIDRIGMLRLRLAQLDERMVRDGDLSPADTKAYLAWSNSIIRATRQLGLKGAPQRAPSLSDMFPGLGSSASR